MAQGSSQETKAGEWFDEWFNTDWYSMLYNHRDDKEAQQFVRNVLQLLDPPADARILDLACGKGRLAIQLAELGYEVYGIDIAEDAIAFAKQFEQQNLHLLAHDMREEFKLGKFDLIFNFFTSFGYFDTDDEHLKTLVHVRKSLKKGGCFVLDYLNTPKVRANLVEHNTRTIANVHFDMKRQFTDGHFYKQIVVTDNSKKYHFEEKVRGFTLQELSDLFAKADMSIKSIYGDYQLNLYDPIHSDRLIIVAQK